MFNDHAYRLLVSDLRYTVGTRNGFAHFLQKAHKPPTQPLHQFMYYIYVHLVIALADGVMK